MLLQVIFVGIIFLNIFTTGYGENIICYHGESNDILATNVTTIHCPSGKCLMFSSACNTYWATTCYNEKKPMSLVNAFKNVKKYYKISSLTNRMFQICNMSACNYNNLSPFLKPIVKPPISFDSFLWPNFLKAEKPKNTLQNGFKFLNGLATYERFEFVGQTFNQTKSVWIKYDFVGPNNSTVTLRFDFNLSESFYILRTTVKSSKKNVALQNSLISSVQKHELRNPTRPGEKLALTLTSRSREISINLFNISLPSDLQNLLLIQYGGNWVMSTAKLIKDKMVSSTMWVKDSESTYEMIPTFDIQKPSTFACNFNTTLNTTLKYQYIGNTTRNYYTSQTPSYYGTTPTPVKTIYVGSVPITTALPTYYYGTTPSPIIGPPKVQLNLNQNEMIEYEVRESLCPNSNLRKIQIENVQSNYLINIWKRFNSGWTLLTTVSKDLEICKSSSSNTNMLNFYTSVFTIVCNNTEIFMYYYDYSITSNYIVEGIPQKLHCNAK